MRSGFLPIASEAQPCALVSLMSDHAGHKLYAFVPDQCHLNVSGTFSGDIWPGTARGAYCVTRMSRGTNTVTKPWPAGPESRERINSCFKVARPSPLFYLYD